MVFFSLPPHWIFPIPSHGQRAGTVRCGEPWCLSGVRKASLTKTLGKPEKPTLQQPELSAWTPGSQLNGRVHLFIPDWLTIIDGCSCLSGVLMIDGCRKIWPWRFNIVHHMTHMIGHIWQETIHLWVDSFEPCQHGCILVLPPFGLVLPSLTCPGWSSSSQSLDQPCICFSCSVCVWHWLSCAIQPPSTSKPKNPWALPNPICPGPSLAGLRQPYAAWHFQARVHSGRVVGFGSSQPGDRQKIQIRKQIDF